MTPCLGNSPKSPEVHVTPAYIDVEEGQSAEFRCQANGNPTPALRWRRVDSELNPRHQFRDGIFRIPYVTYEDRGEYVCSASNSLGSEESTVHLYVRRREEQTTPGPDATKQPVIKPADLTTRSGNQFTLTCLVPRDSEQEFSWEKTPGQLSRDTSESNGILTVYNAQPEDSGTYKCIVRSGQGVGYGYSRVTVVSSNTPPTLRVEPEQQVISQGASIEIKCTVSGEPKPSVKWTKVGDEFGPNIQQIGDVLHIRNAQVRDRGVYVCVAKNDAGFSQGSTIVDVERREPPRVEIYPEARQVVNIGGNVLIQCRILSGIPTPNLTWKRLDGLPLPQEVEELAGGALRFNSITEKSAGSYTCHAINEAGETSALGIIEVQEIPSVTIYPREERLTLKEGDRLRLECRAVGKPNPIISWSLPETLPRNVFQLTAELSG